ncbi:MAG: Asp-tRNA(Asn)/Glu-tRNA(Gln) amidotransferase subunit GatA [bacterium]|nr:Asp-tRNA(Asn)/Glu-tRNA(Gln) amidotransferase subunit GatA [bacterium]
MSVASNWLPISELAKSVSIGQTSAVSNVQKALENLKLTSNYQHTISLIEQRALDRASEIDSRIKAGESVGPLAGVPFVAKDNFLVFGANTTAASNMLKNFAAPYQSSAIEKLETAGAICVGKANLDAFAHGSSTENSDFFTTKNPVNPEYVPGGSSGGSAAIAALGAVPFTLGTDTGGSIRLPASYCGIVGLKPTYGLVSRSGVVAMASSTDCVGPLARTVEDAAYVLDIMAGRDPADSTTIDRQDSYIIAEKPNLRGQKIGVVKEFFGHGISEKVDQAVNATVEQLKQLGAEVSEVSLPSLPLALAVYYVIVPAEVSSNLSRYDGIRFGHRNESTTTLEDSYLTNRSEGFGAEAKRRIMIGTYVLSSGYYDAYYKKAQTVRTKIIDEFNQVFNQVDYLVGPTAPDIAFQIGQNVDDPLAMYLVDIMTVSANLVGVPSISIPVKVSEGDMPIGLQIMAPQKKDKELLALAASIEEKLK